MTRQQRLDECRFRLDALTRAKVIFIGDLRLASHRLATSLEDIGPVDLEAIENHMGDAVSDATYALWETLTQDLARAQARSWDADRSAFSPPR